jgi:hypothetical protein
MWPAVPVPKSVEVAIDCTALPLVVYKSWPVERFDEVARPQYVQVEAVPPTRAPKVPEKFAGNEESESEEVATFWSAPLPAPYTRLPAVNEV